jgi:hypothetical protein
MQELATDPVVHPIRAQHRVIAADRITEIRDLVDESDLRC